jgi:autotransporter-associated beta strand protein
MFKTMLNALVFLLFAITPILAQKQMETLNRGLVAVRSSSSQVFISWRLFGYDPANIGFNLYRGSTKLNTDPITGSTNFTDNTTSNNTYTVKPVINGVEQSSSESASVWTSGYKDISLNVPSGGTTPSGETYTYSPNDASVGDVDGDGQYEILFLWEPSNAKDNSQGGYTGNVYLDAYKLNGGFLWRIDLGVNIRAGAHYSPFLVYDFDGDGKAEVACKTAPGTKDGLGNYLTGAAAGTDNTADYRNSSGYILSGPEYLTIFQGSTGKELKTIDYVPARGTVSSWGDGYGNRVDRFLACVAYLDGKTPSLVMCRGYYTRTVLVAYNWKNNTLTQVWKFDTNDNLKGKDGKAYSTYAGQGNHNLGVADVDNDGFDEIEYGSMTVDHDGVGLFSTGLGHGDAQHLTIFDPLSTQIKQWSCHEESGNGATLRDASNGKILYQLMTGGDNGRAMAADIDSTLVGMECWTSGTPLVTSAGVSVMKGSSSVWVNSYNFAIWWDGDLLRELLDGSDGKVMYVKKWNSSSKSLYNIMTFSGTVSNNSTKANPCLSADILGDWREEVVCRTSDNTKLRIFTTTIETNKRIYTLMHDPVYRVGVARENAGYNQPPHTGFFLGYNMKTLPASPFQKPTLVWKGNSAANNWDIATTANWLKGNTSASYTQGDTVLFDISGVNSVPVTLSENLAPGYVTVLSANNYILNGSGALTGSMGLLKAGLGNLSLTGNHTYIDSTIINQGTLYIDGTLANSPVRVGYLANLGGAGSISQQVIFKPTTSIYPGAKGAVGALTFAKEVTLPGQNKINIDFSAATADKIVINGNLTITDSCTIVVNKLGGEIEAGTYPLITYSGTFTGDLSKIGVSGLLGQKFNLSNSAGTISITIEAPRAATTVIWTGANSNEWDFLITENWLIKGMPGMFSKNDTVIFDDNGAAHNMVTISGSLPVGKWIINGTANYTFSGTGEIAGTTGLYKSGSGHITIDGSHSFTGPVSISGGSLTVNSLANNGTNSSLGASTSTASADIALNNTKLIYTNSELATTDRGLTITGNDTIENLGGTMTLSGVIAGSGKLVKTGSGTVTIKASNTYSGGTVIKEGTLSFGSVTANVSGFSSGTVTLEGGAWSLFDNSSTTDYTSPWNIVVPTGATATINAPSRGTFTGSLTGGGNLSISIPYVRTKFDGNWSAFTGTVSVSGSQLRLGTASYNNMGFYLSSGVTASYVSGNGSSDGNGNISIGELSGASGSFLYNDYWTVGAKNTDATFAGVISGNTVTKVGTGIWTLSGANTYTGATTVSAGTLNITGSLANTAVTVNSGATLSGTGSIAGATTINGIVSPGDATATSSVGTLTVSNSVTLGSGSTTKIDINKTAGTKDVLTSTSTIKLGGTLALNLTGTFAAKDSFKILSSTTISGTFGTITPNNPGSGLSWDTTHLRKSGYIIVKGKQAITFNPIPTLFVGEADYDPAATVSPAEGTIVYSSANTSVATIVNGKIHAVAPGTTVITASVTGQLCYRDTTATQTVEVSNLHKQTLTFASIGTKTYGNASFTITATSDSSLTPVTYTVIDGTDVISLSGNSVTILKSGTVKIRADQGGTATCAPANTWTSLTVNKAELSVIADNKSIIYGETPTYTYSFSGFKNADNAASVSGTPTFSVTKLSVGTRAITVSAGALVSDKYSFTFVPGSITIDSATLTITPDNKTITYGTTHVFSYSVSGLVNNEVAWGGSGVIYGSNPVYSVDSYNAGEHTITMSKGGMGASNYRFVFNTGILTVNKATLDIWVDDKTITYGDAIPELTSTIGGFVNGDDISVLSATPVISTNTSVKAGTYPITVSIDGVSANNYTIQTKPGTLTINKADLTLKADNKTITYGQTPELTYTITGFVSGDDQTVLSAIPVLSADGYNSGSHTISISTKGITADNYNLAETQNGTLTVNKALLTVTVRDTSREEGKPNPDFALKYSGFVNFDNADSLDVKPTVSCAADSSSPNGTYAIEIAGGSDNNYDLSYQNGTLTVTKATAILSAKGPNVLCYPNPVADYLNVAIKGNAEFVTFELYNTSGVLVKKVESGAELIRIDMSGLASGVFTLRIVTPQSVLLQQVIKQ